MCFVGETGSSSAAVQAGRTYYVVVDGAGPKDQGTFELTLVLQ
jgi:hypothetical protein